MKLDEDEDGNYVGDGRPNVESGNVVGSVDVNVDVNVDVDVDVDVDGDADSVGEWVNLAVLLSV